MKRAPPPPRLLEESIDQAPDEIEKERQRGIAKFGKLFDHGDHIAIIQLQQVTIQLQASLLEKLRYAAFDDDSPTAVTDFSYLADTVDMARDRTVAVLVELKKRLSQPSLAVDMQSIPETKSIPDMRSISSNSSKTNQGAQTPTQLPSPLNHPILDPNMLKTVKKSERAFSMPQAPAALASQAKKHPTWSRDFRDVNKSSTGDETTVGADEGHDKPQHRKRNSLLHFLKHNRTTSTADKNVLHEPIVEEPRTISTSTPADAPQRPHAQSNASTTQDPEQTDNARFTYETWEDDPSEIWGGRNSISQREQLFAQILEAQSTSNLERQQSNISSVPHQPPSPVLTNRTNSTATYIHGSTAVPTPNPENEYLGFCKGAWKLQNGDRKGALSKNKEVDPWSRHPGAYANAATFLACQTGKCAFRSHFAAMDPETIYSRVFVVESKGIKFRWPFLAKSHVQQKVAVKHQYSFKCLFCVFLGGKSGVYHGVDDYLQHINSEHRGARNIGEIVQYKTGCVLDRVADDTEEFDINLFPLNASTSGGASDKDRQKSDWLSDDLMIGEAGYKEPTDSMFGSNEPWNEGLSDFHYRSDEFEYT